jgi:hypothetical protein
MSYIELWSRDADVPPSSIMEPEKKHRNSNTSWIWKAMESNRFLHVFRKKKGLYF